MPAVATMTYAYADSTAVLGPLAFKREPGGYDLCAKHAAATSVPRGWDVIRLPLDSPSAPAACQANDDLLALAEAVRAIGLRHDEPEPEPRPTQEPAAIRRIGHLRLISSGE